ncbi:MAG: riboflavin synthase [Gammaproteobacteria bacterium]|jgi:riboflavin synthase|nr:riboflavin synthase [Gammaproteobacteria bacterium]MDP6616353.1 riboflavin synthase [Gammaproteobacteria bacterium]MDP6695891.1 riboflavin synthase [Gammaproteobacteria bacterium]
MFTGIVTATGTLADIDLRDDQGTYRIDAGGLSLVGVKTGDSIAVNGVCLTVTALNADGFSADVSKETLDCTTLGERAAGDRINLERALVLGDSLGGHLVTGHVDGVGEVTAINREGDSVRLDIQVPQALARYIATKGSICVDGVSLTVNNVDDSQVGLMIIPHTQDQTIIAGYEAGTRVNIEVDMIARYLERIVQYTGGYQ